MATVFVTGATGFLGSSLLPELHSAGHKLRCLVRPGRSEENIVDIPHERVEGCVTDDGAVQEGMRGADMVVHMAALVSFHKHDTERLWQINGRGTDIVARAARHAGVSKLLHVSTALTIGGSRKPEVLDETFRFNMKNVRVPYLKAKREAERVVLVQVARGLDAVIVNPAPMFGPGDRRSSPNWVMQSVADDQIRLCPPGGVSISDVRDVTAGCLAALDRGRTGERYILGGDNLTGRQLMQLLSEALGKAPIHRKLPRALLRSLAGMARLREVFTSKQSAVTAQILRLASRYFWYSSQKAEDELGYEWRPALDCIRETHQWSLAKRDTESATLESSGMKIRA